MTSLMTMLTLMTGYSHESYDGNCGNLETMEAILSSCGCNAFDNFNGNDAAADDGNGDGYDGYCRDYSNGNEKSRKKVVGVRMRVLKEEEGRGEIGV